MFKRPGLGLLAAAAILSGCGGSQSPPGVPPGYSPTTFHGHKHTSTYIKHVVLLIQENRSFDDFFATFPGADGTKTGMRGNKQVNLQEVGLRGTCDFAHSRGNYLADYDNQKMDGFAGGARGCKKGNPYQYVNPSEIAPYWDIAKEYVLADHMFQTQGSGSFTAHQDLIRGLTTIDQSRTTSLVDFPTTSPWGCDAPPKTVTTLLVATSSGLKLEHGQGPYPCTSQFPGSGSYYATMRDLFDKRGMSWKYYTPAIEVGGKSSGNLWDAYDMIAKVRYGPEWQTKVISPETTIFKDISSGNLAHMSWLVPDGPNSDHPADKTDTGPSWVASVVNAIGESQYWNSTAIIVVWDDWGGFYDHVKPPIIDNWGGLGFRVPMLIISPYARETSSSQPGYISHTRYEFGSILRFVEDNWGLGTLGTTDERAHSIVDSFDFSQQPRPFVSIPSSYSRTYFEHQPPSNEPVDTE
ncbi:MAG TPA: alkaline phosphatase family protein [Candidatus Cybelea sp.]|jgi:phospholipase C